MHVWGDCSVGGTPGSTLLPPGNWIMSAVAGIYRLDGSPVDRTQVGEMVEALAHRGPDSVGLWAEGSIGLGHRMLWTTPESLHESLPLVDRSGNIVLTADARIDNRDELIDILHLTGPDTRQLTDSALIMAAYERWATECPARLIGDFSLVLWDKRRQLLFCARDPFGVRPLYYYQSNQIFAFASEIKALLRLPEVPRRLDELRVGYHLTMTVEDNAVTFYRDIARLPAAHSIAVEHGRTRVSRYWSLDPQREIRLGSDDEYAEAFRDLLTEAVRCRLRSAYPVGSLLSGGLDSSTVTCLARNLLLEDSEQKLHVFTGTYQNTPQCDERTFVDQVLAQGHLEAHEVDIGSLGPLTDWEQVFWHGDEPHTSPTIYLVWALCRQAKAHGVRVLLDGVDGDTAVSYGEGYLAELARSGRWQAFVSEAEALAQHRTMPSVHMLFQQYAAPYLTELGQSWHWWKLCKGILGTARHLNLSRWQLLRTYAIKPIVPRPILRAMGKQTRPERTLPSTIRPDFAKRIALDERVAAATAHRRQTVTSARQEHFGILASGVMPYVFELGDRTGAAFTIEARHPFADRRLIEFCLALPAEQKLRQGWNRYILRRAMADILPPQIQWRGGKTVNCAAFTYGFTNTDGELVKNTVLPHLEALAPYMDLDTLNATYGRYVKTGNMADEMVVWHAVTLALWLRHSKLTI